MATAHHVKRIPVEKSTAFSSIGYDPERQILAVEFASGGVHHLSGVSQESYNDFAASESKGSHFHRHLRTKYPSAKVDAPALAPCPSCGDTGLAGESCEDCGTAEYGQLK